VALTLLVRPQCRKKLSAMEHKRKSHLSDVTEIIESAARQEQYF
jgi:hypothetical protein